MTVTFAIQLFRNNSIESTHLDAAGQPISDRHVVAKAIKTFDAWLIADKVVVEQLLKVPLPENISYNLELLPGDNSSALYAKSILDNAIDYSSYTPQNPRVKNRSLEVRWELAAIISLQEIRQRCQQGYSELAKELLGVVTRLIVGNSAQFN